MRSTVEPVDPTTVKLTVEVEPDELRPSIDRTVRRLAREIKVPGFRKGHVPRQVMEARLGRETILEEAIEHEAVPEFYARAVQEQAVEPLTRAKVDMEPYAAGEALHFSATVEVKPQIELPSHEGIVVEAPAAQAREEDVDAQLDRLRERFAQLEVIGRPLAEGDYAQIDLRAYRHDQEVTELTTTDALYEIGSGRVVPELDRELTGTRKGDILRFNATVPEAVEGWGGQEVTFQVLVKEAKTKVLPKLDDEFAAEASEFDTLDELRQDLRSRLAGAAERHAEAELESRVLEAYLDRAQVPLPASLVADELNYRADRFARQLAAIGIPFDQYLQSAETTQEQIEADLRAQAERAVKAQLVLEALAAEQGFEVGDDEVETEIGRQAERLGRDVDEVRQAFSGDRAGVVRGDILRAKALTFLVAQAGTRPPGEQEPGAGEPPAPTGQQQERGAGAPDAAAGEG